MLLVPGDRPSRSKEDPSRAMDQEQGAGTKNAPPHLYFCTTMPDLKDIPLVNDKNARQFEMTVNGHMAKIEYEQDGKKIFLTHTLVPKALEGQGVGSALVEKVLTYIEEAGLKLVPMCPFVAAHLRRHTEWQRLLEKGVRM